MSASLIANSKEELHAHGSVRSLKDLVTEPKDEEEEEEDNEDEEEEEDDDGGYEQEEEIEDHEEEEDDVEEPEDLVDVEAVAQEDTNIPAYDRLQWPVPYSNCFTHLIKTEFGKYSFEKEAYYATDLENEDECQNRYQSEEARMYIEACKELGVTPISYFLHHMHDSEVVLRHRCTDALDTKALVVPLLTMISVLTLDLEDNRLGAQGAVYIAELLRENYYITTLNLAANDIGDTGCQAICNVLQENRGLTNVNLSRNNLTAKCAPFLAAMLQTSEFITNLNLSRNRIGEMRTGAFLQSSIAQNSILEQLDLSWNCFRGPSAVSLIKGIEVSPSLTMVNLSFNGIGDSGAAALNRCFRSNTILKHLDITNNRISFAGAKSTSLGLKKNETLAVLKMGSNPITPEGAVLLVKAVGSATNKLDLLELTDICVRKDFDDLYTKVLETGRQLIIKHGGVIEMSNQPLAGVSLDSFQIG